MDLSGYVSPPPPVTAQSDNEEDCAVANISQIDIYPMRNVKLLKTTTTRDVLNGYISKKDVLARLLPHICYQALYSRLEESL